MSLVEELDEAMDRLSLAEQLWLMERLAHRIRAQMSPAVAMDDGAWDAMAADPEVRREIGAISAEFAATEGDGLAPAS